MIALKTIAIILDIIFTLVIVYFLVPLKWEYEEERASIIGFWWMPFRTCTNEVSYAE